MTERNGQGSGVQGGTWLTRVLFCLVFFCIPCSSPAEEAYQIKAAFLYNFTKFVTWPEAMEQQGGELTLCIFDGNPFGDYANQLNGRKVRNFQLRILQPASVNDLAGCNILFVSGAEQTVRALQSVATLPVLTVSDQSGFAARGGAIELLSEDNRIRFDVNLQRIRDSGLTMSSKLLQLARQVL